MKTAIIQMAVRAIGLIQLVMGVLFWLRILEPLLIVHILLGCLIALAMIVLIYRAKQAGVPVWKLAVALIWAYGLPVWGLMQSQILPGALNWITQVLHVICGVGAIGISEYLTARIIKKPA